MTYTVWYRRRGQLFRRKIRGVVGDWFLGSEGAANGPHPGALRCFELESGSVIDIPCDGTQFWFSPERLKLIKERATAMACHQQV